MNKEELIEELKKEIEATKNVLNCEEHFNLYAKGKRVGLEFGWMFAEKLDEPELPVIPQFVADWIKEIDENKNYLFRFIMRYPWNEDRDTNGIPEEIIHWIFETDDNILLTLKLIKNDTDYTIEKEPRWIVSFEAKDFYSTLDEIGYFKEFIKDPLIPIKPNGWSDRYDEEVYKFKEKEEAEAVALLINGTVIEVME